MWFCIADIIKVCPEESDVGVAGEWVDSDNALVLEFDEGSFKGRLADVQGAGELAEGDRIVFLQVTENVFFGAADLDLDHDRLVSGIRRRACFGD